MSGGPSISIPHWLGSAKEAFSSITALSRKSKKADFHKARADFVEFEHQARNFFTERNRLRAEIVAFVLKFPDICRQVGETQAAIDKANAGNQAADALFSDRGQS